MFRNKLRLMQGVSVRRHNVRLRLHVFAPLDVPLLVHVAYCITATGMHVQPAHGFGRVSEWSPWRVTARPCTRTAGRNVNPAGLGLRRGERSPTVMSISPLDARMGQPTTGTPAQRPHDDVIGHSAAGIDGGHAVHGRTDSRSDQRSHRHWPARVSSGKATIPIACGQRQRWNQGRNGTGRHDLHPQAEVGAVDLRR
jgi:hypothetical protein